MGIVTIRGIPVYEATITGEGTGMFKISLVDDPAVMSNFLAFNEEKRPLMYAIQDEEKRLVRGVVMRADFPIYRRDNDMGEYYVIYKADQIRLMAEKYLVEGRQNDVNLMHEDGSDVEGVQMVQYFIKGAGISVEGFDDIADGSLLAEFHVVNDDVWAEIKEGTYKGFSLEGVFDLVPVPDAEKDEVQEIVDKLKGAFRRIFKPNYMNMKVRGFLARLAKEIVKMGNATTDKGILAWDGEDDLKAGDSVYIEDENGERIAAPDGDYKTGDNKVIVVVDGKVSEIKDAEAEVESEFIETDKGKLEWDNEEEDLKAGDAVYVRDEEGNRVAAPDGDYTTNDGKVIKVADGKVTEIVDKKAEVSEEEVKAKRQSRFARMKELFEESFETKMREIANAIAKSFDHDRYYLVDAGENFGVVEVWDEDYASRHYYRYPITWNEDGTANAGEPVEVKQMFVPMDFESPFESNGGDAKEEEMARLKAENEDLKAQVEKLQKTPGAKPAHEEVETSVRLKKTGDRHLDNLQRILNAK